MKLTPRGPEVDAVVRLLEDDSYASAEALARAIIKTVADELDLRDWYALTHRWRDGTRGINWGPFASPIEALRVAEYIGAGQFGAVKLYSPGVLVANAKGRKNTAGYCRRPECGHAPFLHLMAGSGRGGCGLSSCGCPRFTK
ncbi:hypothetical protein [Paractinoplanes rishiriensis]|uniref:Uncharacterized protein n=1 Tax=Paractinoplanes rishiriensis TaxID=1050105 RepID=A0A919K5J2_9ACTN|nr:hypothetical protein [Actinoplanes rishiriensis]GIE98958.1 hypothetical protein Ari01nite_64230 [Actinoplanes rishiriensis]